jgi:hypothetical protein
MSQNSYMNQLQETDVITKQPKSMKTCEEIMSLGSSAYEPNNPDFRPEKDVPQARGCATPLDILGNS